jgi:hypothetical protein
LRDGQRLPIITTGARRELTDKIQSFRHKFRS